MLSVLRAEDYDEALRLCSENEFGNGVAIFTRDGDAARDFASRVQVGMVGINVPIPVPIAYYTFGGWKASGFGDLNQHGADAFRFYTKTKTVTSRWPSGIRRAPASSCRKEADGDWQPRDEEVLFEQRGRLGVVTLNRPKAVNALTAGMVAAMLEQLTAWADDDAVATVLVQRRR